MTYNPEPEIERYLKQLTKAARGLPRGRRRELVAEIEQHIRDALIETPVDNEAEMLTVLDRIGDPYEIAAAESGKPAPRRSTAMETGAIILLLLGGFLFLVGWFAGVALLWSSSLWTRRDKLIGTLIVPGGLATGMVALSLLLAGGVGAQVCSTGPILPTPLNSVPATYSQAIQYAERRQLSDVVFQPAAQEIHATHQGKTIAVSYPTDQSAVQFQDLLHQHHIAFRSVGTVKETCSGGASTLGVVFILLALAVLLIAPIATAIYLGRRLEREKLAAAALLE